jgi:hypothetical protein
MPPKHTSEHCEDHCDLLTTITEVKKDTEYLRKKADENKEGYRFWIGIIIAASPGVFACVAFIVKVQDKFQ